MKVLGTVPFINSYPLTYFVNQKKLSLEFFNPSDLLLSLKTHKSDVSLLPIADHLKNKEIFSLQNKCISSFGKVDSVILISKVDLKKINSIYLDSRSSSSNLLVQIIFNEFIKSEVDYKFYKPNRNMIFDNESGYVVIGDIGLELTYLKPLGFKIYDLAEIWFNETSLPFTFASYNYINKPNQELVDILESSYYEGFKNIDKISEIIHKSKKINLNKKQIAKYISETIVYEFSTDHIKGINLYLKFAKKLISFDRLEFNK